MNRSLNRDAINALNAKLQQTTQQTTTNTLTKPTSKIQLHPNTSADPSRLRNTLRVDGPTPKAFQ